MTRTRIFTGVAIIAITVLCLVTVGLNPAVMAVLVAVIAVYVAELSSCRSRGQT